MNSTKDVLLILASICFIIVVGGAVYEHLALIPTWTKAPPVSFGVFHGEYRLTSERFWMYIHPVTLLLMIGALITNWKTNRRRNLTIVLGSYFLILAITTIYFVPQLMKFMETPVQDTVDETLLHSASMWETLSLVRLVFIFGLAYFLLSTLTKSNETIVVQDARAVPLSYPNDALGG